MGLTKSELFSAEQNEMALLAKAIGHPARIAILDYLQRTNQCVNGFLVEELGLAQATVSQHLKALKQAGLVRGTVAGTAVNYCIDPSGWQRLQHWFEQLLRPSADAQNPLSPCSTSSSKTC